jgi:arginine/lysine/ornithine decarboxylase
VLAPGEVITAAIVEQLEEVVALGGFVEGATDQALDKLRVVAAELTVAALTGDVRAAPRQANLAA